MSREEHISCDNLECEGGKFFMQCGNGHDICNFCWITIKKKDYCPICLETAKLGRYK